MLVRQRACAGGGRRSCSPGSAHALGEEDVAVRWDWSDAVDRQPRARAAAASGSIIPTERERESKERRSTRKKNSEPAVAGAMSLDEYAKTSRSLQY